MNKIRLLLKVSTIILLSSTAHGKTCESDFQAQNECCSINNKTSQLTRINRMEARDKSCLLNVYPADKTKSFRSFIFGDNGKVTIFLQPGGDDAKSNSSQSYFLFPFGERPFPAIDPKGALSVKSGSGHSWMFDSGIATPTSIEGCQIEVSSKFSLYESGFKIKSCKNHLLIETKVEVGGDYIAYLDKTLVVRDPRGQACEIKNSDLYTYEKKGKERKEYMDSKGRYHNQTFRYRTNDELAKALKKLCSNLDVSMLLKTEPAPRKIDPEEEKKALDILEGRK